jgi:adenosylmethionine-8-amino-7-oxononanoate aminotransferase
LALGDVGLYKGPYASLFPQGITALGPIPQHGGPDAPGWSDEDTDFDALKPQLEALAPSCAALVYEPLLQGAGGMRLHKPAFLRRLCQWARAQGIYLIADEILTGFWRTGTQFASETVGVWPDFLCLSKGLTGGWMPFSAVLLSEEIYGLFYGPYGSHGNGSPRNFLHSNTFTGNALAAAVAWEAQQIYAEAGFGERVTAASTRLSAALRRLAGAGLGLKNPRAIGLVAAADWDEPRAEAGVDGGSKARGSDGGVSRRFVLEIQRLARERGLFLRPLGHTLYWMPPLTVSDKEIDFLEEATGDTLKEWNRLEGR